MRDVMEAADHLMRADEGTLRMVVHHDPDMVRDVAAALIARQAAESRLSSVAGLVEAAHCARIKLSRYRQYHPETWVGGVETEYQAVIRLINAALSAFEASDTPLTVTESAPAEGGDGGLGR